MMIPISRNSTSINVPNAIGKEHHVNIPSTSDNPSSQKLPLNLPCRDLLDDNRRDEYLENCFPLYIASMEGDWQVARHILEDHKNLVRFSINGNNETALHVAVSRRNITFVENLISLMEKEDLELQDNSSYTALSIAVTLGDVKMAKILLKKNEALLDIPTSEGIMPLQMAALIGRHDMLHFLYNSFQGMQGNFWSPESRSCFLLACVEADFFDIALRVLKDHPDLGLTGGNVLRVLAQKTHAFMPNPYPETSSLLVYFSPLAAIIKVVKKYNPIPRKLNWDECLALKLLRIILKNVAKLPWTEIHDIMRGPADQIKDENREANPLEAKMKYSLRVLFLASEVGNIVFLAEIIRQYPELLYEVNDLNQSIFHIAVSHRHEYIYGLIYEMGSTKDRIITLEDENGNNMLHLVGIVTGSEKRNNYDHIPGAAQQMQRELLWFKEVESILPISLREKKNFAGLTPREEFTKHHKDLVSKGEKWMKDMGAQLMVVAALLTTISFAATITFAGGYNQDTGYPIFSENKLFPYFIIYNFIAFLCSSASIISVLSLLTSRYAEDDFVELLPYRLMLSVATMFLSIIAMITAFICNLFLLYENRSQLLPKICLAITIVVLGFSFNPIMNLLTYMFLTTFGRKATLRYDGRFMPPFRM